MAPVRATAVGITPQIIDDEELSILLRNLNSFNHKKDGTSSEAGRFMKLLEEYSEWKFEEQVDLYEWIPTLNSVDMLLNQYIETNPNILLVAPLERQKNSLTRKDEIRQNKYAVSAYDAESVPESVIDELCIILTFLSSLLQNCTNKAVFNSVEELVDLLAAGNDSVANLALQALSYVATPPALHKQQAPDSNQHTSSLHTSKSDSHKRLVSMARGWGSRGSGLGLYACVTADNSEFGQGDLPPSAGEINFEFFAPEIGEENEMDLVGKEVSSGKKDRNLISIHLSSEEIVTAPLNLGAMDTDTDSSFTVNKQKRQRTGIKDSRPRGMQTHSAVKLFFKCIDKVGGREKFPEDRLFSLLADVRLARSYYSLESRISAVENRLMALISILYAHPSQDIMSGYFLAQPEFCIELIDLLRPTVSSNNVSSASLKKNASSSLCSITALACPQETPFSIRSLALETLTALVARRDGASGGLTGVARQSNILNELGVGKGMYLGLLPTLVRYSLASLTNFLTVEKQGVLQEIKKDGCETDLPVEIGLAFLKASSSPQLSKKDQVLRALSFVDSVLTLASAVVSAPSGTAALTDCGMIPALISIAAFNTESPLKALSNLRADLCEKDLSQINSQFRYVALHAIQIIEGAIVTHNNALSAFHDLNGVDVLISRLEKEIVVSKGDKSSGDTALMDTDISPTTKNSRKLVASQRVLLFSIVNCLTVVFHQESTSSAISNAGAQLRKPELTFVIMEVMNHVESYGGVLAALTCSLLSDIMNSDPHVVYHVHKSGIARAFFEMVKGGEINPNDKLWESAIPPVPELIMALPNVIAALALTSEGAAKVKEANPFPELLKVLFHPKYSMPRSRCLLNELTAITGTGLDEVMRHVPSLRTLVMKSIVDSLKEVITNGKMLVEREEMVAVSNEQDAPATILENERTCLVQYTLNFGQMLEQILHTEDHCEPFVDAGGLTAILELFPLLLPPTTQFLANVSCLSSPSVSTLAHTTTEDSLATSFRCIAMNYDSRKILNEISKAISVGISNVEKTQKAVRDTFPSIRFHDHSLVELEKKCKALDAMGILDGLPNVGIHMLRESRDYAKNSKCLSDYLRAVANLQWQINLLATTIKAACQSSQEVGTGWGRSEREWKKELSSDKFKSILSHLAEFQQSAILESCRIRSMEEYESEFRKRHLKANDDNNSIRYRLRIVCQEGAVVRDGIEIDSCANVGSMEMGEITDAYERCINSSGVMRYRTRRGWVSELTRGHGREPIAEVIDISQISAVVLPQVDERNNHKKRMEYSVASIRSVGASVLARLQTCYRDLFCSISRVVLTGIRSLTVQNISFNAGTIESHVKILLDSLLAITLNALNQPSVVHFLTHNESKDSTMNDVGVAMYLGTILGIISSYIYEDKRERRVANVVFLLALINADNHFCSNVSAKLLGQVNRKLATPHASVGMLDAIKFVMENALNSARILGEKENEVDASKPFQSLFRTTAASLPPVLGFLRKLIEGLPIKQSPSTAILEKLKLEDLKILIAGSKEAVFSRAFCKLDKDLKFSKESFVRVIHFAIADIMICVWKDRRLQYVPSYVVHPLMMLSAEILSALEEALKPPPASNSEQRRGFFSRFPRANTVSRQRQLQGEEQFEPSEEAVTRLMEMGFSRDHALDAIESTESNRLEVAMEYALSHPPPSPASIERNRERREARRQRNESSSSDNVGNDEIIADRRENESSNQEKTSELNVEPSSEKLAFEKSDDDKMIATVKLCLSEWVNSIPEIAITLIAEGSASFSNMRKNPNTSGEGNGDVEALTIVICFFIINLCQKYPNKRDMTVRELLTKTTKYIKATKKDDSTIFRIEKEAEVQISALCHATVLIVRAMPKVRTLVLEYHLVTSFISCIGEYTSSLNSSPSIELEWPVWLTPALLLLEVMAQPVVAFEVSELKDDEMNSKDDLMCVKHEHMRKRIELSEMADSLFEVVRLQKKHLKEGKIEEINASVEKTKTDNFGKKAEMNNIIQQESEVRDKDPKQGMDAPENHLFKSPFSKVPPFFPLMTDDMAKAALIVCLRLLGKGPPFQNEMHLPPGIAHAVILLLTRLVRSGSLASNCFKENAPDLIFALPRKCRFNGNAGLVTNFLRRLLEDESNLQVVMETEMRGVLLKLHRKQSRQSSSSTEPSASMHSFLQAVIPLLNRDPWTFLKAIISTVSIWPGKGSRESGRVVTLLSQTERQNIIRAISNIKTRSNYSRTDSTVDSRRLKKSQQKVTRGKSPHRGLMTRRGSFSKRGKKEKPESGLNVTPANHIMSLLIEKLIILHSSKGENGATFGEETSFFLISDVLEIMADLVLAVPTCAAAIHRYRFPSSKGHHINCNTFPGIQHALAGCPTPPQTVVNFLLHCLLPQDRWKDKKDQEFYERNEQEDESCRLKKKETFMKTKIAQTTARLLVSLVARAGEGRRRVLTGLSFALNGGGENNLFGKVSAGGTSFMTSEDPSDDFELYALKSWGDLCIGLAAPRSNGVNHDNNSNLSIEVVRLMLDFKMVHSLLHAIGRVKLQHPMAASVCGSLLIPLEVFTRASVTDAIQTSIEKEEYERLTCKSAAMSGTKGTKKNDASIRNTPRRSETAFADDAMLSDGFDADAAIRNNICDDEDMEEAGDIEDDIDADADADVEMDGGSEEDDEEVEDDEDDEGDSEIEDEEETDDEEAEQSDESEEEGEHIEDEEEEGAAEIWSEDMGEFFVGDGEEELNQDMEENDQVQESDLDGDWDRVEVPPFGAVMLGGRRRGGISSSARGFVDAAEAMIGSLLRTGEIQENALAEIEGTLGIRLSGNRNIPEWSQFGREYSRERRWNNDGRAGTSHRIGSNRNGSSDISGAIPQINQRRPPDVGYSGPGGGGRWNDISSMELVFGGPALTGGNRNFDVVSELESSSDTNSQSFSSAVDPQLFPGGPAASTHSRTQQAIHPLLCGLELPPVNALVSNLLSHGERSTRQDAESNTRRSDDWASWSIASNHGGYVVSTSNGNLVRLSRRQGQTSPTLNSTRSGRTGWNDDCQTPNANVGNFSDAFERALNEMVQGTEVNIDTNNRTMVESENALSNNNENNRNDEGNTMEDQVHNETSLNTNGQQINATEERRNDNLSNLSDVVIPDGNNTAGTIDTNSSENMDIVDRNIETQEGSNEAANNLDTVDRDRGFVSSDGEGVAPSLVEGLRLSDRAIESNISSVAHPREEVSDENRMIDQEGSSDNTQHTGTIDSGRNQDMPLVEEQNEPNANGLICPPGMDLEVFNSLPFEMQREVVDQHQTTLDLAAQLDSSSGLDPEALAALPEDMRREVIAQEQRERRLQDTPADPSNAEEMDNASFVASLAPDLRRDILLNADETLLNSLPPDIRAEAQILQERSQQSRRLPEPIAGQANVEGTRADGQIVNSDGAASVAPNSRKKQRHGKLKVNCNRSPIIYLPKTEGQVSNEGEKPPETDPFFSFELRSLIQLMFLLSPVRPQRLLQKVFQNICQNATLRSVLCNAFTQLLNDDGDGTAAAVNTVTYKRENSNIRKEDNVLSFPPRSLIGTAPEVLDGSGLNTDSIFYRRRQGSSCAASIAASLPVSLKGFSNVSHIPPVVSTRVVDTLSFLGKNSPRVCIDALSIPAVGVNNEGTCFEHMLNLLKMPRYTKSSTNLESLLTMLEIMILPLSSLPRSNDDDDTLSPEEIQAAASTGKEWIEIPRIVISQHRLQLLCSILKLESCRDAAFTKVNGISRRLCKVEVNKRHILGELASVAQSLGEDAKRELRLLFVRMNDVVILQQSVDTNKIQKAEPFAKKAAISQSPSSTVTLSSSSSELKFLRVLQTLQSLCSDNTGEETSRRKSDATVFVTGELIEILQGMNLNELWEQLSACLKVVKILEGISSENEVEEKNVESNEDEVMDESAGNNEEAGDEASDDMMKTGKKLQNSSAGLLTRFLPAIEAFFVVNASAMRDEGNSDENNESSAVLKSNKKELNLVGGNDVIHFVSENKVILNALVRNNSNLLEKGLRALVQVPRCRAVLDFDVKRQWFKTQIRRLRQQASRRHGSLRLGIRRKHVFADAYHQLRLRNAEEMRSRLHITFRNEEGVDAGGLSREFFGILAKEMFNPNYALFTSTEDGCTFQPNPNSSINPDHLSYFRFVGRIVGKAVADGFLLDAHFTRSLYKHMLGLEPTHHDMEAIDPDYYKNLKMILEYSLADIGLELTFSIDDHSFGRSQIIDLVENGRNIAVTDETKAKYVSLVCKHRMTKSIKSQIKAYLAGFNELINPDLIAIFTPRELELLISGLPDIDIHDLKENTEYQGWKATDSEILWFWNIMFSLNRREKAAFLQFVTGSSKVPLAGFSELQGMRGVQKFSIHKAGGVSTDALMSAHTCFNSLDLPKYETEDKMKEKLLYAISEGQGGFLFA